MSRRFVIAFPILAALALLLAACTPVEFSPDGKRIVFCWSPDGTSTSLFTMNTDGTGLKALPGGADGLLARWSHDGKRLAVVQWGPKRTSISLYNADGSGQTRLPLPVHANRALVQRLQTYVSRHYPGMLQRRVAQQQAARR